MSTNGNGKPMQQIQQQKVMKRQFPMMSSDYQMRLGDTGGENSTSYKAGILSQPDEMSSMNDKFSPKVSIYNIMANNLK